MGAKRRPTNAGDHLVDSIQLDRSGDKPLYLQLGEILRQQMASGRLPVGAKLPATRELSDALSVNRATVVEAYRWLRLQGWVRSGVGSGTYVTGRALGFGGDANLVQSRPGTGAGVLADAEGDGFWSSRIEELPRPEAKSETQAPAWTIRFTSPTADPDGFPIDEFRSVLEEVLDREGARSLDYGPPDGYGPLRELIAERLARQSVRVDPSQVLLVNGSQQGLDLVFRMLVPKGRTLILEEPTYHLALRTARALRLPVAAVPLDAEGLRIDRLERVLDETDAGMLYTMPVFQNPTGLNLSAERRERLLSLSAERKLPVVEDHFDAELDYRGDAPPPLLSHGSPQNVVLLGTFSKILFPGLRVGWMVVPEALLGPFSEMKVCADLSGGLLTQMALDEFCRRGHLDAHLERVRARNRRRLVAMLDALEAAMPREARWTRPTGGMALWLWLPSGVDSEEVAEEALRRGLALTPGTAFCPAGGGRDGLRLSFVRESEERIREGTRLLADTIRDLGARSGRSGRERAAAAPIL